MSKGIYKPQFHKLIVEWISLLWQHLGAVVILSIISFFGSVPILSGGVIFVGLFNFTKLLVAKELALREDFTSAIKEKWKTATALFLIIAIVISIIVFDLYFFWNYTVKAFFWIGVWFAVMFAMGLIYIFPMLADQNVGVKKIFARSFRMALVDPIFTLLVVAFSVLWIVLCVLLIPMLPTLCLGGFAIWTSIAYREMGLKVDSILAKKDS